MSNKEFETLETNKEIKNMSIEERRQAFLINYKKDQKIQLIVSVVFVVLVLAGLFLILNYPSYLIFTFLGILICFVGLSTYSKTCSKKKEANIKDFVESYREYERSKVYDDRFNAISNESYKEVAKEEIIDLNLFSSTQVVESNNYIDARYLSKEFKSYSLAINKETFSIEKLIRPLMLVPETMTLDNLIIEFKKTHGQMAVVIDEFGGTSGLITLEDVLEEIIGEVQDEFDEEEEVDIKEVGENTFVANAMMRIDELVDFFDLDAAQFEEDDVETIAGLVVKILGRIANVGDTVTFNGFTFTGKEVDGARITKLEIYKEPSVETINSVDEV